MKFAIRVSLALAFFFIDVRVYAKSLVPLIHDKEVIFQPDQCLVHSSVCAISTNVDRKYEITFGKNKAVLGPSTTVIRLGANAIALVKGMVWVMGKGTTRVESEFGVVESANGGTFWVTHGRDRINVFAIDEDLKLIGKGHTHPLSLVRGFTNWVGKVSTLGLAKTGIPESIPLENHIIRWAQLYPGGKKEFELELRKFHQIWANAVEMASQLHRDLAYIEINREKKAREMATQRRQRIERRQAEMRDLFRKKNYIE